MMPNITDADVASVTVSFMLVYTVRSPKGARWERAKGPFDSARLAREALAAVTEPITDYRITERTTAIRVVEQGS